MYTTGPSLFTLCPCSPIRLCIAIEYQSYGPVGVLAALQGAAELNAERLSVGLVYVILTNIIIMLYRPHSETTKLDVILSRFAVEFEHKNA